MSAIFGVVHWDERAAAPSELDRMSLALSAHGPEENHYACDGPAGLGHRLFRVTPEDDLERQPVRCVGGDGLLVADARLDNRDELARRLGIDGATLATCADTDLIAAALEKWGEEAPASLRGAFAFALWNRRTRTLLLARSPFHERPLFFHASPQRFAFASMPKALFALGGVTREINEEALADFLAFERFDEDRSYFRQIGRVPAGQVLVVRADGSRRSRFWRPEGIRELTWRRDEDYVEAFTELFTRVVGDALRSAGPIGAMVSGGFDSSSVAAVAAPLLAVANRRLHSFTEVPDAGFSGALAAGRYSDETPYIEALARRYDNIDVSWIRTADRYFLTDIEARLAATELPVKGAINMSWWDVTMAEAQRQGVRVLLQGCGGNFTLSWNGDGRLGQLVAAGQWLRALQHARGMSRGRLLPALRLLAAQAVVPNLPHALFLLAQQIRHPGTPARYPWRPWAAIHPEFERAHRVRERAAAKGADPRLRPGPDTRAVRLFMLHRVPDMFDGYFAGCQARFGVEVRDPTADSRLIEFCLALPERQYQDHGHSRWLVRRAMAHRLPPAILENRQRGLQAADWLVSLQRHQDRLRDELARLAECDLASRAIDLARLRRIVDRLPTTRVGDPHAMRDARGVLEHGLMAGRFILWAERAAAEGTRP